MDSVNARGRTVLCRADDVPDGGALGIEGRTPGDPGVIIVRRGARIAAYRNDCPHAHLPLDLVPGRLMARDGHHLLCANHGALFEPETGLCVRGPCAGRRLARVGAEVREGAVVVRAGRA